MPDAESKVVDNTEGQNEKVQSINIPKGVIKFVLWQGLHYVSYCGLLHVSLM